MPCEVYSRIVGYYRPVQGWNEGKREEFGDRETVDIPQNIDIIEEEVLHDR